MKKQVKNKPIILLDEYEKDGTGSPDQELYFNFPDLTKEQKKQIENACWGEKVPSFTKDRAYEGIITEIYKKMYEKKFVKSLSSDSNK